MQKKMKLKGRVKLSDHMEFSAELHDGTAFSLPVGEYDVQLNEDFATDKDTVDGWLFVTQEAQQDTRCYLTLPKPTLQFGKQIVVHQLQLMPRNASLNSFNPKLVGSGSQKS